MASDTPDLPVPSEDAIKGELAKLGDARRRKAGRFILAALSAIPWVGGLMSASASLDADLAQGKVNELQQEWLEEHKRKLHELVKTLTEIAVRIERIGQEALARLETEEYLGIVRKAFGVWDRADTDDKRKLIQRLISNAAGTSIATDDLVRLFIEWIDYYHEIHFAVIRAIYKNPRSTRSDIWNDLNGADVQENSAEADLFRKLIRDLSTGGVIRQHRETTGDGHFIKGPRAPTRRGMGSRVMKSAFDDKEEYELTGLGEKFVHYVLTDVVTRIAGEKE